MADLSDKIGHKVLVRGKDVGVSLQSSFSAVHNI